MAQNPPAQYPYWWVYHAEAPEKVETFSHPLAQRHTTFYGQKEQALSQFNANSEPEKIHTLVPESYRTVATDINPAPSVRTTFYA